MCLICSQQVAVAKEYNIKGHHETHAEKYGEYTGQLRTQKLNELASLLEKQQAVFSKCRNTHEGSFYFYTYLQLLVLFYCTVSERGVSQLRYT